MVYDVNVCKQWLYVDHCRHDGNHFNVVVGAVVMMLMMMVMGLGILVLLTRARCHLTFSPYLRPDHTP